MKAPANRPKFLRHYASPVELRVEQIGPNLWCCSVYRGTLAIESPAGTTRSHLWDAPVTTLTEESAKQTVMAAVQDLRPSEPPEKWRDLSDVPEESWQSVLAERKFSGYPPREGMERWTGF